MGKNEAAMAVAQERYGNRAPEDWEDSYEGGIDYLADDREVGDSTLNPEQALAVASMLEFVKAKTGSFFLLSGAAGTGKTYCIRDLIKSYHKKIVFTAPTNKATKVLRSTLTTDDYTPICKTIYSLLGLKLEPSGALKKLVAPEDPVDLRDIRVVVVDEASMVNKLLWREIQNAADTFNLKIIFMGDSNQLPPVGEKASAIWGFADIAAELTEVMRFDNQILTLAELICSKIGHPAPTINLKSDNDGIEGVWMQDKPAFRAELIKRAKLGDFTRTDAPTKAIAWRNVTVGSLNKLIRGQIFENANEEEWLPGDRILLSAPVNDVSGKGKNMIGCTDDEGAIERISIAWHPNYPDYKCYNISLITDENKRISLWVLHPNSEVDFKIHLHNLSNTAKANPRKWRDFWQFKEAFHSIKHAYAITAHRAQGSTYGTAFVVWNDILLNRERGEAFRCLYVACTRPKDKLYLGSF